MYLLYLLDCRNPPDVVFALDSSGSIGHENFQRIVDFTKEVTRYLPVGARTRVGLETFSDRERVGHALNVHLMKVVVHA